MFILQYTRKTIQFKYKIYNTQCLKLLWNPYSMTCCIGVCSVYTITGVTRVKCDDHKSIFMHLYFLNKLKNILKMKRITDIETKSIESQQNEDKKVDTSYCFKLR